MFKLKGQKVLVVGLGKTGESAARYLAAQGAKVTVTDEKTKNDLAEPVKRLEEIKAEHKFTYELGKFNSKTFTTADLIVLSPGVPRKLPEVQDAINAGITITNDLELARAHITVPLICVTGTNGKTTTTTMISEMLKADGKNVFTCGNIGTSALELINQNLKPNFVVMEVSSFQCESLNNFKPDVLVLTNLEPNHLDRYASLDDYYVTKKKLISKMDKAGKIIVNYDNPASLTWVQGAAAPVYYISKKDPMTIGGQVAETFQGAYLKRPKIICKINGSAETSFDLLGCKLPGDHNRENFMAAACTARLMGCSPDAVQKTILEFRGVIHRLECIRRKDGVLFYNDSKSTSVAAMKRSLSAFNAPIILIAGGRDKDEDFTQIQELVKKKVKNLILIGESKEKINRHLGDFSETFLVGTFEEAVLIAFQKSRSGEIILFSPGCSSFDMFRNFEERGDYFKKLVAAL